MVVFHASTFILQLHTAGGYDLFPGETYIRYYLVAKMLYSSYNKYIFVKGDSMAFAGDNQNLACHIQPRIEEKQH